MSKLNVDLGLVRKYNVPGPRYTSYPPATQFTDAVSWADVEPLVRADNEPGRGLSLYFHIPFCESLCWFCGCTNVITTSHHLSSHYLGHLEREMDRIRPLLHSARRVVQLHWGGGSPTFLQPDEIRRLGAAIRGRFAFADDFEAGVEVDPRRLTRDHVAALREAGFNRASLGVQDFDPRVQEAVHRIQPRELTERAVGWLHEGGFASVNVDLIYGLPRQTVESFSDTLDAVLRLAPDRFAVFSYAHVPWMKPAQKILIRKSLPSAETKLGLLKLVIEKLTEGDRYIYIGMDHFARPGDELAVAQRNRTLQRNFQGYSTRAGADIFGFGMSSISQIPDFYWQNIKDLAGYQAALDSDRPVMARGCRVGPEDKIRRETIMRVMCDLSLDYAAMSQRLGVDFARHFEDELASLADLEADGLVRRRPGGFDVTETGRLFIRNIAMRFDARLAPGGQQRHSKTI